MPSSRRTTCAVPRRACRRATPMRLRRSASCLLARAGRTGGSALSRAAADTWTATAVRCRPSDGWRALWTWWPHELDRDPGDGRRKRAGGAAPRLAPGRDLVCPVAGRLPRHLVRLVSAHAAGPDERIRETPAVRHRGAGGQRGAGHHLRAAL